MRQVFIAILCVTGLAGCGMLTLTPCDFSWPVESVLKVQHTGMVQEQRYSITCNVKSLLFTETQDSVNIEQWSIRMIRDTKGYFYMTAAKFKHVYVFGQIEGGLKLSKAILISENGMEDPKFNQRPPYIQLMNGNEAPVLLTNDGIQKGDKK